MTSLQLALFAAGAVLVAAVIVYNWLQERKVRRRIEDAFRKESEGVRGATGGAAEPGERIEPTLAGSKGAGAVPENIARDVARSGDEGYEPPLEIQARIASEVDADPHADARFDDEEPPAIARAAAAERGVPQPDPDVESIVLLQPVAPVSAGKLAAGLHARLGMPLRWFGRRGPGLPWQLLKTETVGEFSEICVCLLLANRAGAASQALIEAYFRLIDEIASSLPAAMVAPDAAAETARAETLDRICADLDVQIGLTVLKTSATMIAGTRLRGIAEASGFRLVDGGRFDWVQEETGTVLYSLQNYRSEPFTADTLRATSTPGAVFLLDVPRVADPVRVYDQMKLAARRMAQTLDATLVDDNRRPLDDAALNAIRDQVRTTAQAMREVNIEPGSARALALFGG